MTANLIVFAFYKVFNSFSISLAGISIQTSFQAILYLMEASNSHFSAFTSKPTEDFTPTISHLRRRRLSAYMPL